MTAQSERWWVAGLVLIGIGTVPGYVHTDIVRIGSIDELVGACSAVLTILIGWWLVGSPDRGGGGATALRLLAAGVAGIAAASWQGGSPLPGAQPWLVGYSVRLTVVVLLLMEVGRKANVTTVARLAVGCLIAAIIVEPTAIALTLFLVPWISSGPPHQGLQHDST